MTTSGLLLYAIAAMCVADGLTSSLLTNAFRNRFIFSQLVRPIDPDESMTKAMSTTVRHSLSDQQERQYNQMFDLMFYFFQDK